MSKINQSALAKMNKEAIWQNPITKRDYVHAESFSIMWKRRQYQVSVASCSESGILTSFIHNHHTYHDRHGDQPGEPLQTALLKALFMGQLL